MILCDPKDRDQRLARITLGHWKGVFKEGSGGWDTDFKTKDINKNNSKHRHRGEQLHSVS